MMDYFSSITFWKTWKQYVLKSWLWHQGGMRSIYHTALFHTAESYPTLAVIGEKRNLTAGAGYFGQGHGLLSPWPKSPEGI